MSRRGEVGPPPELVKLGTVTRWIERAAVVQPAENSKPQKEAKETSLFPVNDDAKQVEDDSNLDPLALLDQLDASMEKQRKERERQEASEAEKAAEVASSKVLSCTESCCLALHLTFFVWTEFSIADRISV